MSVGATNTSQEMQQLQSSMLASEPSPACPSSSHPIQPSEAPKVEAKGAGEEKSSEGAKKPKSMANTFRHLSGVSPAQGSGGYYPNRLSRPASAAPQQQQQPMVPSAAIAAPWPGLPTTTAFPMYAGAGVAEPAVVPPPCMYGTGYEVNPFGYAVAPVPGAGALPGELASARAIPPPHPLSYMSANNGGGGLVLGGLSAAPMGMPCDLGSYSQLLLRQPPQPQQQQAMLCTIPSLVTGCGGVGGVYPYGFGPAAVGATHIVTEADIFNQYYLHYMRSQQQFVESHMMKQALPGAESLQQLPEGPGQAAVTGGKSAAAPWIPQCQQQRNIIEEEAVLNCNQWNPAVQHHGSAAAAQPRSRPSHTLPSAPSCTPPVDSLLSDDSSASGSRLSPFNINAFADDHCLLCGNEGHCYADCPAACDGAKGHPSILCFFNEHDKHVYVMRHEDWVNEASLADVIAFVEKTLHRPRATCELWVDGRSLAAIGATGRTNMTLPPKELRTKCCQLRLLPGAVVFVASPGVWDRKTLGLACDASASVDTPPPATMVGPIQQQRRVHPRLHPSVKVAEVDSLAEAHLEPPRAPICLTPPLQRKKHASPSTCNGSDDYLLRCPHRHSPALSTKREDGGEDITAGPPCLSLTPPTHMQDMDDWTKGAEGPATVSKEAATRSRLNYTNSRRSSSSASSRSSSASDESTRAYTHPPHSPSSKIDASTVEPGADLSTISAATPSELRSLPLTTLAAATAAVAAGAGNDTKAPKAPLRSPATTRNHPSSHGTNGAKSDGKELGRSAATRPTVAPLTDCVVASGAPVATLAQLLAVPLHPITLASRDPIAVCKANARKDLKAYNSTEQRLWRTLHVKFLPDTMSFTEIRLLFMQFGEVLRVRVICPQRHLPSTTTERSGLTRPAITATRRQPTSYPRAFYVGFVEYGCRIEAEIAKTYLNGRRMSSNYLLAAEWCKQPITGGFRTDYDEATGKPCTFGLTLDQIAEVNRLYNFVFTGPSQPGDRSRPGSSASHSHRSSPKPHLSSQGSGTHAQTPDVLLTSPMDRFPSPSAATTPASSHSSRSLGPLAGGSGTPSPQCGGGATGSCAANQLALTASTSTDAGKEGMVASDVLVQQQEQQQQQPPTRDSNDSFGVDTIKQEHLQWLSKGVLQFFLTRNDADTARAGKGREVSTACLWSRSELDSLAALRAKLRESCATYATAAVEPLFHSTLNIAYELLAFPGVCHQTRHVSPSASATTTRDNVELGPHPLLLQLEAFVYQAALYVHHDGHGDGRSAARVAQQALSLVHHFASGLTQLHLLCNSSGSSGVTSAGTGSSAGGPSAMAFHACATLPQWRALFTAVPLAAQFSTEAMASIYADCTLKPLPGDSVCVSAGVAVGGADAGHAVSVLGRGAVLNLPYPRLDVCCFLIERLLQLALLLDTFMIAGTDVVQGGSRANNGVNRSSSSSGSSSRNSSGGSNPPVVASIPLPGMPAAAPMLAVLPPSLPRSSAHSGVAGSLFTPPAPSGGGARDPKEAQPATMSSITTDSEDESDLQFIRRVKIELVSVAEQLYRQLDGLNKSGDTLGDIQVCLRKDFGCVIGSFPNGVDSEEARLALAGPAATEDFLAMHSFWASLSRLINEQLPSCAAISGTVASPHNNGAKRKLIQGKGSSAQRSGSGSNRATAGAGVLLKGLAPMATKHYAALLLANCADCRLLF